MASINGTQRVRPPTKIGSAWHRQAKQGAKTMVFSALSATVCGCFIKAELDDKTKKGRITCAKVPAKGPLSQIEVDAVMSDAKLLLARVRRTLGAEWNVEPLEKAEVT
jgi:hypothetical protein